MEILDIFDENHNYIGVCNKKEVHEKGYWHQVFGCLLIDSTQNLVYLQYKNKDYNACANQNKLDISVGGHLVAGEQVCDGIREIKEEASLSILYENLIYVGMRIVNVVAKKDYIIREFCYLHIYDDTFSLKDLKSQDKEVLHFVAFDIDELISFLENPTTILGTTPTGLKTFSKEDFIKPYLEGDQYYLKYMLLAKKVMNKEKDIKWTH